MSLEPMVRVVNAVYFPLLLVSTFVNIAFKSDVLYFVFVAILALQVITLPMKFRTSAIAIRELKQTGILNEEERHGAKKVLRSLSLSHIAAIVITLVYVVRF